MTKIYILLITVLVLANNNLTAQKKSPFLKKGDTISIVAPAGILKNRTDAIKKAKKLLESWGITVLLGKNIYNQNNHFAGTDKQRLYDFQKALDNPKIKAIWAARGGYGSVRIIDKLNFTKFKKNPKWIIGYSDITVFHNHINNLGYETIHAMMPKSLEENPKKIKKTIETFKKAIFGENLIYKVNSSKYNRKGTVSGILVGGNITILSSLLGSISQIKTRDKILFIEDIGEYKYSIDRMLQSLKRAGLFNNIKGIIVGDISKIKKNTTKWGSSIEQLILDVIPKNIPILFNFPAGHKPDNRALFFGKKILLKIENSNKKSIVKFK